jgi:hypothetical protein
MTKHEFGLAVNCDIRHLMQAAEAREQQEERSHEVNRLRDMADDELPAVVCRWPKRPCPMCQGLPCETPDRCLSRATVAEREDYGTLHMEVHDV